MTARETAIKNMTAAFKLWGKERRTHPEQFMTEEMVETKTRGYLAKRCAVYFAELLDRVSGKK